MYLNQIFELSMVLGADEFSALFRSISNRGNLIEEDDTHFVDCSLENKGILFRWRNSSYKKHVKVIINAGILLGDDLNAHKLIQKLNKQLSKYWESKYDIDDFTLSKLFTTTNIHTGSQSKVDSYLKILKRIGKVKGYTPTEYGCFGTDNSFCLSGNSNDTDFLLYDLRAVLKRLQQDNTSKVEGIIVAEVRLNKPRAIRAYADELLTSDQIIAMFEQRAKIFFDVMTRIVPDGVFCKKTDAIDRICREVKDARLRRRMIKLVALVPEKRSLLLAQKALNYRHVDVVMDAFRKIGLSPITIGKRQDTKYLESIYSYMM